MSVPSYHRVLPHSIALGCVPRRYRERFAMVETFISLLAHVLNREQRSPKCTRISRLYRNGNVMTDSTFAKFNAYWPFDRDYDALQHMNYSWGLLSLPESTNSNQSEGLASSFPKSADWRQRARYRQNDAARLTRISDESGIDYDYRQRVCESKYEKSRLR